MAEGGNIRVLVVDDEQDARGKVIRYLEGSPQYRVVGEAGDGEEALELADSLDPDLVFLDIQMPRIDGFTVAANLSSESDTGIIFITAYDKYAVGAFELNAIDYLLKPFDRDRFTEALNRFEARAGTDNSACISRLIRDYRAQSSYPRKIAFRSEAGLELVAPDAIEWLESSGNYVKICLPEHAFMTRQTMTSVLSQLPEETFVRIHRSYVINTTNVLRCRSIHKGDQELELTSGVKLRMSRNFAQAFFEAFDRNAR